MRAFATIVPVKPNVTSDEVKNIFLLWAKNTNPKNAELQNIALPQENHEVESAQFSFRYLHIISETEHLTALRFTVEKTMLPNLYLENLARKRHYV